MSAEIQPLNPRHITFVRELAKSRVTQTVFEQMFRQNFNYHVFPFGYEVVFPDIALSRLARAKGSTPFEYLRATPDFRIYPLNHPERLSFVEVKYRGYLYAPYLKTAAENIAQYFPGTYLFIATPEDFYMSSCDSIIDTRGEIKPLTESQVVPNINEIQKSNVVIYHQILSEILKLDKDPIKEAVRYNPRNLNS